MFHVFVCFVCCSTSPSSWRDMKVVNNHAYIISEAGGHGMQVFDLTQLRGLTGVGPADMREFESTAHMDNFGQAHNIASNVEAQRVYVIGSTRSDCTGSNCDGACSGGEHGHTTKLEVISVLR